MKSTQPGAKPIPQPLLQPYEKSPIYREAERILILVNSAQARMDRRYKYTDGNRLSEKASDLADQVAWAYMETKNLNLKIARLQNVIRKSTSLLIAIRSANRRNLIFGDLHVDLVTRCVSVIKQATGWINKVSELSAAKDIGPERMSPSNNPATSECHQLGRITPEVKDQARSATPCGYVESSM